MHAFPLVVAKFSASVFSHQVRQRVRIQQPRLRPDGPHVFQGVNWRLPSRLHVTSQTFSHDATVVPFAKRHWDLRLFAQFLQIVDPPQATEEKSHSNKKNVVLWNSLYCSCLRWECWCESVSVCGAALSSEIKSSVCEINDLLSLFVAAQGKSVGKLLWRDYIW